MSLLKKTLFTASLFLVIAAHAQDTLPNFTARILSKDKNQISWINPFKNVIQLTVQRSFDSTAYFKTIYSAQSPWLPQNGFVDNTVPDGYKVYYRIQYIFEGGEYFFTRSKSARVLAPAKVIVPAPSPEEKPTIEKPADNKPGQPATTQKPVTSEPVKTVKVYRRNKDTLVTELPADAYRKFRDSMAANTQDTLYYYNDYEVLIKPFGPKPAPWKPSKYIFINKYGYVAIQLAKAAHNQYKVIFYDDAGTELFRIKHVKEADLVLDKANFIHAGWFFFEIYENDKFLERNKFYLSRD